MTCRGHIKNGVAIIDEAVALPDGTSVLIEVEGADRSFWSKKSVEQLALEQGVQPINILDDLAIDWPKEESADEFLELIREVRH